ncbi:MAG TPA: hypothetical protein VJ417_08175, partial [Candidatus Glassbacteria bacterium]|nr:hypothetical protein [Candidatus Glassbacteria bacterium]
VGEIRCRVNPQKIIIKKGKAEGVELDSGETLRADFVVSGLDPQQSFIELLADAPLPDTWRKRTENFQYNLIAPLFALNLNLAEAPCYRAAENLPELEHALMVILGLEHYEQYPEIVACHEQGKIPATVMWGSCPTVFDPAQAPEGRHTAFMWEKLPYAVDGDPANWDRIKDGHGRHMLELWGEYAPNLAGDAVLSWFTRSPLDVERQFPNMRRGDLLVGAFTNGQIGFDRPFPGAGNYRGYFEGYYLCGSCCHPGGNITGLPGYNCAQVLLADLGIKAPWTPEPLV